jgi:glycosyltransferase involved in cell wall biosynthesis
MPPFFSIVMPTRNRPHFLKYALKSLQQQNFEDFEVIVSSNSDDHKETVSVVDSMNDPRIEAVCTPSVLSMGENFNYGLSHANGRYVSIISDKTLLLPGALQRVHQDLLNDSTIDVISWLSDWYSFKDEGNSWEGFYHTQKDFYKPSGYEPQEELKFRLSFLVKREELSRRYFRGQIYYNFFSRELIERIKQKAGKVFFGVCPDYTGLILGLIYSKKSYDIGMSLSMMFVTKLSNGNQMGESEEASKKYLSDSLNYPFEEFLENLPFPRLYQSVTNLIAYDFIRVLELTSNASLKKFLNYDNLALCVLDEVQKRFPADYQKIILDIDPESNLLKNVKIKKVMNFISKMFSQFNREEVKDNILLYFAKYFQNSELYAQKLKQRDAYFAEPCSDPMVGLKYGHKHYSQLSVLNYK